MNQPDVRGLSKGGTSTQSVFEDSEESLSPGEIFEMLSNTRRRQVVHYLLQQDDTVRLRDLSRQIAAWENDVTPEEVTAKQRKRVYTALHQSHLPKLDDCGVIEFNDNRSLVTPTDRVSDLQLYLEVVPGNEIPWSVYYTGLGLFSGAMVLVKAIGLFPFSELPALGWALIIVLLFTGSALVHVYYSRRMRLGAAGPPPTLQSERE